MGNSNRRWSRDDSVGRNANCEIKSRAGCEQDMLRDVYIHKRACSMASQSEQGCEGARLKETSQED